MFVYNVDAVFTQRLLCYWVDWLACFDLLVHFNKHTYFFRSKLDRNVDSIAEPFYKLVNEIFESRGTFKWLRKSFIMFVEVTFGRTINRFVIYIFHQTTIQSMAHVLLSMCFGQWYFNLNIIFFVEGLHRCVLT